MTAIEKLERLLRTRNAEAEIYIDEPDVVIEVTIAGTNVAYERGANLEYAIVLILDTLGVL